MPARNEAAAPVPAAVTPPALERDDASGEWRARGRWSVLALDGFAQQLAAMAGPGAAPADAPLVVDGSAVEALDTVGALLLARWAAAAPGREIRWQGWTDPQRALLERMATEGPAAATARATAATATATAAAPAHERALAHFGRASVDFAAEALDLLSFLGETATVFLREALHPARFRWRAVLHHVGITGVAAIPIVGLLGLLMGVVVAYQGAGQLARYGANIFVVDLVSLSMLREFAPLVTAIIVAGRSGSAFAAQLGTMSVTEEIDALRALGLSPIAVLVLPRLLALVIVLPLLTAFSDAMGLLGGMIMASVRLHVTFTSFLERLPHAVSATTLLLGVGKAPVFAGIVAVVGCYQGLRTKGGADSVGTQTTRAVVQSIFLVISADAVFSVAFSMLDL
jgi:phospholipid/cholesterol/gamma-HCH transport system permease protein